MSQTCDAEIDDGGPGLSPLSDVPRKEWRPRPQDIYLFFFVPFLLVAILMCLSLLFPLNLCQLSFASFLQRIRQRKHPCYTAFHDQEWGVPVHDDRKLFEMLVLSGALAEMAWPVILSKRDAFREVFMDFDPLLVSKLNEKKFLGPCSPARSLLSEHRLRTIVENAHELLKIIEEFGSLDEYCWGFLNYKPMVGRYRSPREVPLRTPKAEALSQDLMRRGLRGVGPTVVYAFMQAVGMANDHLATCYRLDECAAAEASDGGHGGTLVKEQEMGKMCGMMIECVSLESSMAAAMISIS
uniref:Putative GMP synthase (Glutamine-hydrolyzing) n=1 Tax=Aegilops tauschii TaxID=37682 RepID=N1QXA4_AEGTA